ncbi:MAG: ABC transporter permease [Bacteroidetes bacterium]|nr:ABC transporter permease [Bacteroidota bacterium]MBS1630643.1 ABC transporter permease [Bacteroidota bacterium]
MRHQKGTFAAFIIRLAMGATALSVAVMIVAIAFIGGFKETIREKLFSFWGEVLVVPYDANSNDIVSAQPVPIDSGLMKKIQTIPGVTAVYPFILKPGILQSAGEMEGIRLKGITPGQQFPSSIRFKGKGIDFSDSGYAKQIILSQRTADRLRLKPGDDLRLYFISGGSPRIRKLQVTGTYHTGMEEVDRQFALCDTRLLQRLAGWEQNEISGYQVELAYGQNPDTLANEIYYRYLSPPMDAQSIKQVYEGVFSWLGTQDTNGRILLIIVGIVALINLASAMLILMVDRATMIGLLKALGMPPRALWMLFLSLAGLIGGCGILLGNLLGLGLCLAQVQFGFIHLPEETYNMSTVPVRLVGWQILTLDAGTLLLCILCTLLPLLYIRRIQPARVLHFQ